MKRQNILMVVVFLLIIGGGLYYFLKEESMASQPQPVQDAPKQQAALSFEGNKITEEEEGRLIWELTAETIEVDSVTQNVTLHQLNGTFYSADGTTMTITSQTGNLDSKTKDVVLTGSVHGTASSGGDFTAAQATWQDESKLFHGTGGVKAVKGDIILTGDVLDGDMVLNKINVSGHAHIVNKGGQNE